MYAYMLWADTTAGIMKMRNGANSAWVSLWELDGTFIATDISLSAGTAGAPSLYFTGDTNTGIYSPGADQLAISTNGTGRIFIDSTGKLGVGVSSPAGSTTSYSVDVYGPILARAAISAHQTNAGVFEYTGNETKIRSYGATSGTGFITFGTGGGGGSADSERLRITSTGAVGVGVSSPTSLFHVGSGLASTQSPVTYLSAENGFAAVACEIRQGRFDKDVLVVSSNQALSANLFNAIENGTSRFVITGAGNVGIGTTSPSQPLHIATSSGAAYIQQTNGTATTYLGPDGSNTGLFGTSTNHDIRFMNNNTERVRIDTSGRLLVGTSSTSANSTLVLQGASGSSNAIIRPCLSNSSPGTEDQIGMIAFGDSSQRDLAYFFCARDSGTWTAGSSQPTRLVFSTTADGASSPTERVRINAAGGFKASTNGAYSSSSAAYHEFYQSNNDQSGLAIRCAGASFTDIGVSVAIDRNTTNNTYYFIRASVTGVAYRFNVADSGNCTNTNNSYTGISDIKLKENIVDASLQWNDIKALQIRNYNFKEETGQPTHRQIGLIAQELELVCPNLVDESPDLDDEGNDLGTVTKSVNYSVLYMKAVKALQEAMERIETLEAKVAALESA
jgi:hypothetical protein